MSLYLGELEGFRYAATPDAEVVVCNHGMKIYGHVHVLKVALLGGVLELPVIPVHNVHSIGLPFTQIVGKIIANTCPEKRRYATHWRHMILIDIVEHLVIQRDQILELTLREARLGCRDVGEGMEDQNTTMLLLHTLEEQHDRVHHRVSQMRLLGTRVTAPSANLGKYQFHKDRQGALADGIRHQTPLVVVQIATRRLHPHFYDVHGQLLAQCGHLDEVLLHIDHLAEHMILMRHGRIRRFVGARYDDLESLTTLSWYFIQLVQIG